MRKRPNHLDFLECRRQLVVVAKVSEFEGISAFPDFVSDEVDFGVVSLAEGVEDLELFEVGVVVDRSHKNIVVRG